MPTVPSYHSFHSISQLAVNVDRCIKFIPRYQPSFSQNHALRRAMFYIIHCGVFATEFDFGCAWVKGNKLKLSG